MISNLMEKNIENRVNKVSDMVFTNSKTVNSWKKLGDDVYVFDKVVNFGDEE